MRIRKVYQDCPATSPLSPFVHVAEKGLDWSGVARSELTPPMPANEDGQGYPLWIAEHKGHEIHFASTQEIAHAMDVLGQKILPSPRDLGERLRAVNSHWLSRLHRTWKPWRVREALVSKLQAILDAD